MEIDLTTPALLFPTISLLLLAYTNRFLAIATIIRQLRDTYLAQPSESMLAQITNLRKRIRLIREMQFLGVLSLLLCTACMILLFLGWRPVAEWVFGISLFFMCASLLLSLWEIAMSTSALAIHLRDIEQDVSSDGNRTSG